VYPFSEEFVVISVDTAKAKRSIIIGINGWSNLAGVIAGQLYKTKYAPHCKLLLAPLIQRIVDRMISDRFPLLVTMILIAIGASGFIGMRGLLMWENRKRQRVTSTWAPADFANERESRKRRGDMKLSFRYGY